MEPSSDLASSPLADYFFISGIETSSIYDATNAAAPPLASPLLRPTFEEDADSEIDVEHYFASLSGSPDPRSRPSADARRSLSSFVPPASNRSSATIRPAPDPPRKSWMTEDDFDQALRRFVAERDAALDDALATPLGQRQRRSHLSKPPCDERPAETHGASGSVRKRLSGLIASSRKSTSIKRGQCVVHAFPTSPVLTSFPSLNENLQASEQLRLCYSLPTSLPLRPRYTPTKAHL